MTEYLGIDWWYAVRMVAPAALVLLGLYLTLTLAWIISETRNTTTRRKHQK